MSDPHALHFSLLRPAILHILRAAGFHSTKPSVLDTLTDLYARHLLLLAQRTASFVYERTSNDASSTTLELDPFSTTLDLPEVPETAPPQSRLDAQTPTLSDIRQALESISFFNTTLTPAEESWREVLRRPLSSYPPGAARDKERRRRDLDDTKDVRDFIDWCMGPANREIRRIASMLGEDQQKAGLSSLDTLGGASATAAAATAAAAAAGQDTAAAEGDAGIPRLRGGDDEDGGKLQRGIMTGVEGVLDAAVARVIKDDYVVALKKKHSKSGDGARYAGTALGKMGEDRGSLRIEGGPETLQAWASALKRKHIEDEDGDAEGD